MYIFLRLDWTTELDLDTEQNRFLFYTTVNISIVNSVTHSSLL